MRKRKIKDSIDEISQELLIKQTKKKKFSKKNCELFFQKHNQKKSKRKTKVKVEIKTEIKPKKPPEKEKNKAPKRKKKMKLILMK